MKIVAIRGKNLASLPEFELDLEAPPLSETRIFAITGATGAGKSTLLDAICLALYDRAPRLSGPRDVPIGALEVSSQDPRSIMRRGCAESYAQVDFLGSDGHRYRATWEAWKARHKFDGKLQPQRMRLEALPSRRNISGATKTETLDLIESKIGLSFAEFRRAVLLAQGDFAAFLKAKADERAALLERMTGTEIYAEISRAAYQQTKEEADRLEELERQTETLTPLEDEPRQQLQTKLAACGARRAAVEEERLQLQNIVRWHTQRVELQVEQAAARKELELADKGWSESVETLREVERVERAEQIRPIYDSVLRAREAHGVAERDFAAADAALTETVAHHAEMHGKMTEVGGRLREAESSVERIGPQVAQAQALDLEIELAAKDAGADTEALSSERAKAAAQTRLVDELLGAQTANEKQQRNLIAWFRTNSDAERLAAQWPRWLNVLESVAQTSRAEETVRQQAAEARTARAGLEREVGHLASVKAKLAEERTASVEAISSAQETLGVLLSEADANAIGKALRKIQGLYEDLERMRGVQQDVKRLHQEKRSQEKLRAEAVIARDQARATSASASKSIESMSEIRARLQTKIEGLEFEQLLRRRRSQLLRPGHPCPLCGSKSHSADLHDAEDAPAPGGLLDELKETELALTEARIERESALRGYEEHGHRAAQAELRKNELTHAIEQYGEAWSQRLSAIQTAWTESAILLTMGVQQVAALVHERPKLRGGKKELNRAKSGLEKIEKKLEKRLEGLQTATRALEEARVQADAALARIAAIEPKMRELEEQRAAAQNALNTAESEAERSRLALESALTELETPLGKDRAWVAVLRADPDHFAQLCRGRVQAYEANVHAQQDLETAGRGVEREVALARAASERLDARTMELTEAVQEKALRLEALRAERSLLLGGRSTETVRSEVESELRSARNAHAEIDRLFKLAGANLAAADERRELRAQSFQSRTQERESLEARLALRVDAAQLPGEDVLTSLFVRPSGWLAKTKNELDARRERLIGARGLVQDRAERLARHETIEQPAMDRDEALQRSLVLEGAIASLIENEVQLRSQLEEDNRQRAARETLGPARQAQTERFRHWSEINDLIGSSDGRKFRSFAQGLSLEMLLAQANLQLRRLRPRFRLERVPGFDMELQVVDHDMGNEVRSVSTLSGGETFLVSLALALGLSALSSRELEIDSLFIDEGFGQLDPDALEVALATLDQLQAEGRTVGLISHVPDLMDRIGYGVRVEAVAPGRSRVRLASPGGR